MATCNPARSSLCTEPRRERTRLAADIWAGGNLQVEAHPADWKTHGKKAGVVRNRAMVEFGADLVCAFPVGPSVGTRDCIMRARVAGIPEWVFKAGV